MNGVSAKPKRDYGTPPAVVAVAKSLLGGTIDLDPASSPTNRAGARVWYGPGRLNGRDDGLAWDWWADETVGRASRVFLNPPGGLGGSAKRWWAKLVHEYSTGRVSSAFFVAFSIDALQWSQRVNAGGLLAFPCFIPAARVAYLDHETGIVDLHPPKPSVFVWLPPRPGVGETVWQCKNLDKMGSTFAAHGFRGVAVGDTWMR